MHTYIKKGNNGKPYKQNEEAFEIIRKRSNKTGKKEIKDVQAFKDSPQNEHVWFGQLFNENGTITERNIIDKQHFVFDIEAKEIQGGKLEFDRSELDLLTEQLERFEFHYIVVHSHGSNMKENNLKVHIFIETKDPIPADQYEVLYETFRRTYLSQTDSGFFDSRMKLVSQTVSLPRYNPSMHNDPEIPFFVEKNKGKPFDHTTLIDSDIFKNVQRSITLAKEFEAEQAKKAIQSFTTELNEPQIKELFDQWINKKGMRERLALSGGIGEKAMIQIKAWNFAGFISDTTAESFMIELANGNPHFEEKNLIELGNNKKLPKHPEAPEKFLKVRQPRPLPEEPTGYQNEEFDPFIADYEPVQQETPQTQPVRRSQRDIDPFNTIQEYGDIFAFDEFTRRFVFQEEPKTIGVSKEIGDRVDLSRQSNDIAEIRHCIKNDYGIMLGHEITETAIRAVGRKNSFDSVINWLTLDEQGQELQWNPETDPDYLGDFPFKYLGTEDTPLNREIWTRFMTNFYNRAVYGKYGDVMYKYVLCLLGNQDIGKTKLLKKIGGDFVAELNGIDVNSPRINNIIVENILIELGETGFFKKNDIEEIKQFITIVRMKAQLFGGKGETDRSLRCVYVSTSNKEGYINDDQLQRFFPLKCGVTMEPKQCNKMIDSLTIADIKNMFAQAKYLVEQGRKNNTDFWAIEETLLEDLENQRGLLSVTDETFEIVQRYTNAEFPLDTFCGISYEPFHKTDFEQIENSENGVFDPTEASQLYFNGINEKDRRPHYEKVRNITIKKSRVQLIDFDELCEIVLSENPYLSDNPYFKKRVEDALKKLGFSQMRPVNKKDNRVRDNYGKKKNPSKMWERTRNKTSIEKAGTLKFIKPDSKTWNDILSVADQIE